MFSSNSTNLFNSEPGTAVQSKFNSDSEIGTPVKKRKCKVFTSDSEVSSPVKRYYHIVLLH